VIFGVHKIKLVLAAFKGRHENLKTRMLSNFISDMAH